MTTGPKYVTQISSRELFESLREAFSEKEREEDARRINQVADSHLRHALGLHEAELTQSQKEMAEQIARVLKGEKALTERKEGSRTLGTFKIPTEGREPDPQDDR